MKILFSILVLSSYLFSFTIQINLKNVESNDGKIFLGLYDKQKNFLDLGFEYKGKVVDSTISTIKFEDIPSGIYAVSLYHDQNNNGILDKNFLGIPKEGYGFSTNPFIFGEPDFDDVKFELDSDKTLDIEVKY